MKHQDNILVHKLIFNSNQRSLDITYHVARTEIIISQYVSMQCKFDISRRIPFYVTI